MAAEFKSVVRVILAGNSLPTPRVIETNQKQTKKIGRAETVQYDMEPLYMLDKLLEPVAASVHVDVMPGTQEPTNHSLPQQPMHPSMFSKAGVYSSFQTVCNPYQCQVDGVT